MHGLSNGQTEPEKPRIIGGGPGELQKLYEELKKEKPGKDIEIHYLQQTIVKEPQERDEYITHLVSELKKALQKGKKQGTVRRVEGRLVEIDKGAVHKIHERDVYLVYDSSGRYKSKLEVEAIADAISIGTSYWQKKKIEPGDTIKFHGQRRRLALGLIYGGSVSEQGRDYSGYGMIWKYTLRGGWSFEALLVDFEKYEFANINYTLDIYFCVGGRKYFYHPYWISPFVGLGGGYIKIDYAYADIQTLKKGKTMPYFLAGVQLSLQQQLHIDLETRLFYGPKLNVQPEPIKIRPTIYCASISFTW